MQKCIKKAENIGVPIFVGECTTTETMIEAWYLLLTSHTKNGLNFLDKLASDGYYENQEVSKPFFFNGKSTSCF